MSDTTIQLIFPDGKSRSFPKNVTGAEVAMSIGKRLHGDALCIKIDGKLVDLNLPINKDATIEIVTFYSDEGKHVYWHSSSHLMAQAIEELFPGSKFGAGPATENGFYYDVDSSHQFNEEDLKKIEERMIDVSKRDLFIQREEMDRQKAIEYFKTKRVDPYKVEILEETLKEEKEVSVYHQGEFTDLCVGPHLPRTSKLKAVKLTGVSSSYWRGDEKRQRMQRIYGISFPTAKELTAHFDRITEAKKRDHRKIGVELEYFMFSPLVGSGLPIWLPKGAIFRSELEKFLAKAQTEKGYSQVYTPHVGSIKLYETSGHYPYYKDSQFPPISFEDEEGKSESYMLKPMNCPHHHQIFSSKIRSYRDLPVRLAEFGTVYRYEQSGELNGLLRARSFTQDDAHIYCRQDQLETEICNVIELTNYVFGTLGFKDIEVRLSFRDDKKIEKYGGNNDNWERSQHDVKAATEKMGLKYFIGIGEASFYGPKIDFIIKDAIGRKWQLGTVQVDYVMPNRFDLKYVNDKGETERPVIIHRAPFGSLERMTAILIENTLGDFPLWLSPVQAIVLTVTEDVLEYANEVATMLSNAGLRVKSDKRNEKISKKIRDAETSKIPYMLVVGAKEQESKSVSVRKRFAGDLGIKRVEDVVSELRQERDNKQPL